MPNEDKAWNQAEGAVLLERVGAVALVTLSHPAALNALTWRMYEQLEQHVEFLATDKETRVIILRGDGERAFAAGTDIAQFRGFSGADGVAYEKRMDSVVDRLATLPKPVLAAVHGYAVGSGLIISSACDLRYATSSARFGAPVARTLGNCLSLKNYRRLINAFGPTRTKQLLFTGELLSADDALQCGFLSAILPSGEQFFSRVLEIAQGISELAPLTLWATKEAFRYLGLSAIGDAPATSFDEVVAQVYGSGDFAEGVQAHFEKRRPMWRGQ